MTVSAAASKFARQQNGRGMRPRTLLIVCVGRTHRVLVSSGRLRPPHVRPTDSVCTTQLASQLCSGKVGRRALSTTVCAQTSLPVPRARANSLHRQQRPIVYAPRVRSAGIRRARVRKTAKTVLVAAIRISPVEKLARHAISIAPLACFTRVVV